MLSRALTTAVAAAWLLYAGAVLAEDEAMQWLQRVYSATDKLSYTGTFVYQYGDHVETARITRIVDASGIHERVETLDGPQREVVRNNEEVKCYLPQSLKIKIDSQRETKPFTIARADQVKDISRHYSIRLGGVERIAGYDCQALVLEPKDNLRYGHKLWADVNTGMLVKAKTYNDKRELVEQFMFTQLQVGGRIDKNLVKSRFAEKGRNWRVENSGATPTDLDKEGWKLKTPPPGYEPIAQLRRNMGETQNVGHIVLSDGLAAVSIFIEELNAANAQAQTGPTRQGVLHIYTRKIGSHLVTAVGEVPAESVRSIADAVEYQPPK